MERKIKFSESLGMQLKEFRVKHKIKGKDVAELINKSPAYVSKLEKGKIQQIDKAELVKITNFITASNDGYYLFCNEIAEQADAKELDQNIVLLNFDLIDRKLPVTSDLIDEIDRRMNRLAISSAELIDYINQNEDLGYDFLIEHKIDPNLVEKNVWLSYQEADSFEHPHLFIFLKFDVERLDSFLSGKIRKCEYIFPYAIMYHLLKLEYKKQGVALDDRLRDSCKNKTEDLLLQHKFYSFSVQAKYREQGKEEEYLNDFDIDNKKYVSDILSGIKFLSQYDISYTNEKLKSIVKNMQECDISFVVAYMSLSLTSIKSLQTTLKKNFLQDVVELIKDYSNKTDAGENIERY